jgi:hypothetical protein
VPFDGYTPELKRATAEHIAKLPLDADPVTPRRRSPRPKQPATSLSTENRDGRISRVRHDGGASRRTSIPSLKSPAYCAA